jgi:uncharacterized membrane protein
MMNLKNLLNKQSGNKMLLRAMAVIALIGVADTVYLTANRYFGAEVKCLLTEGCEIVLSSKYSEWLGLPLAVWGLLFYAAFFILINLFDIYEERFLVRILVIFAILGFISSLVLLYVQLFLIKAVCFYCLISLISSTTLYILAIMFSRRYKLQEY